MHISLILFLVKGDKQALCDLDQVGVALTFHKIKYLIHLLFLVHHKIFRRHRLKFECFDRAHGYNNYTHEHDLVFIIYQ